MKRKGEAQNQKRFERSKELAPAEQIYPVSDMGRVIREGNLEQKLVTLRLGFDQAVTTDGSGVFATVISNSPVQAQNWTGCAGVFDQYRVLAMRVEFEPYWTVNCTFAPVVAVVDRSDATALTGYGLAERFTSALKVQGKKPLSRTVNMSGSEEASFKSTASPAADNWIKFYSSGNTASFTLGRYQVTLIVQFRGLGIN